MKLTEIPLLAAVLESGADDRVFDSLLLLGPLVIVFVAILGRSLLTEAIALTYVGTFVAYVLYRGVRKS